MALILDAMHRVHPVPSYMPCCASPPRHGAWPQVMEETGYDIEHLVSEVDFIELTLDGKRNKLYIVPGLDPDSAQFAPQCRGVRACAYVCMCACVRSPAQAHTLLFAFLMPALHGSRQVQLPLCALHVPMLCAGDWWVCVASGC